MMAAIIVQVNYVTGLTLLSHADESHITINMLALPVLELERIDTFA